MTDPKPTLVLPAELAALQAEAIAIDAQSAPPTIDPQTGQPPVPVNWLEDAKGLIDIGAESLGAFYPRTAPILDDAARGRIAGALAPVLEKHGWSLAGIFGAWGAEINLAFVCAQIAVPIAKAIRADRAEQQAEQAAKPAAPPPPQASPATGPKVPTDRLFEKA